MWVIFLEVGLALLLVAIVLWATWPRRGSNGGQDEHEPASATRHDDSPVTPVLATSGAALEAGKLTDAIPCRAEPDDAHRGKHDNGGCDGSASDSPSSDTSSSDSSSSSD